MKKLRQKELKKELIDYIEKWRKQPKPTERKNREPENTTPKLRVDYSRYIKQQEGYEEYQRTLHKIKYHYHPPAGKAENEPDEELDRLVAAYINTAFWTEQQTTTKTTEQQISEMTDPEKIGNMLHKNIQQIVDHHSQGPLTHYAWIVKESQALASINSTVGENYSMHDQLLTYKIESILKQKDVEKIINNLSTNKKEKEKQYYQTIENQIEEHLEPLGADYTDGRIIDQETHNALTTSIKTIVIKTLKEQKTEKEPAASTRQWLLVQQLSTPKIVMNRRKGLKTHHSYKFVTYQVNKIVNMYPENKRLRGRLIEHIAPKLGKTPEQIAQHLSEKPSGYEEKQKKKQ